MKATIASAVILLLILVLVAVNGMCVHHTIRQMTEMVDALPDVPDETTALQIHDIHQFLEKKETLLSFSVPFVVLDRGIELCKTLESYADAGAVIDYAAAKVSLADAIQDMSRLEKIEWKNIF